MTEINVNFNKVSRPTDVRLDNFREMVNYDNTKNKGYVRMALGSDGKVVLQKVNNKVDCSLKLRFNMGPENNANLRQLFLKSMQGDFKYMTDGQRDELKRLILKGRDAHAGEVSGTALSRVDVREIFAKYDAQFNTMSGRRAMYRQFLASARMALNLPETVTDSELVKKYLKLQECGLGNIDEYCEVKPGEIKQSVTEGGTDRINMHEQMTKTEGDFRQFLFALEGRLAQAEKLVSFERKMQNIVTDCLVQNRTGVLTQNEKDALRTCLTEIAKMGNFDKYDVIDGDQVGSKGGLTEKFLNEVVPAMLRRGLENVGAVGGKPGSQQQMDAIDANFEMEDMRSLYEEFIIGAHDAANAVEGSSGSGPFQELDDGLDQGISRQVASNGTLEVMKRAAVSKGEAIELGDNMKGLMKGFGKEAKVNAFVNRFIRDKFPEVEKKSEKLSEKKVELALSYTDTLVTAAQIQFGSRVKRGDKYYNQDSTKVYLRKMFDQVLPTVCNKLGGGLPLYNMLLKHTVPTMMNRLIREVAAKPELRTNVIFNDNAQPLEDLSAAFLGFRDGTQQKMISVAIRGFDKLIDSLVKKNKLSESEGGLQEASDLKNRLREQLGGITARIAARYFAQDPGSKTREDFAHELKELFIAERNAIMDDFNTELNALVFSHLPRNRQAKELANTRNNVYKFLQANPGIMQKYGDSIRPTLERMYNQRLCASLKDAKVKNAELPKDFATKFLDGYEKDVKNLLGKYETFSKKLNDKVMKNLVDGFYEGIEDADENSLMGRYKGMPKDTLKELAESFAGDMFNSMQDKLQSLRDRYLANPEGMEKEKIDDLIQREFYADDSTSGVNGVFKDVVLKREVNLTEWIGSRPDTVKKDSQGNVKSVEDHTLVFKNIMQGWADEALDAESNKDSAGLLNKKERLTLTRQAAVRKYDQVARHGVMYGAVENTEANQKAFQGRVQRELGGEIGKSAKEYARFKSEFLRLVVGEPRASYGDMDGKELEKLLDKKLGQYTALTYGMLANLIDDKLDDLSKRFVVKPLDVKAEAQQFQQELKKLQDKVVADNIRIAMERKAALTKIFNTVADEYDVELKAGSEKLREAGASEEDVAYYERTLVPELKNKLQQAINNAPDSYMNEEKAVAAARDLAESHINVMVEYFKQYDLDTDDGLQRLVDSTYLGLKRFMTSDPATKRIVFDAVRTWVKTPENHELYRKARQAQMAGVIFTHNLMATPMQEATRMEEAMEESLRQALMGYLTQENISSLNKDDVPKANELFAMWLDQYHLPETSIVTSGGQTTTIREMAMEMFYNRTKEVMERLAQDPSAKIQLLDVKFMKEFLNLINTKGMEVMLYEVGQKFAAEKTEALFSKEFYQTYFFNPAANGDFANADESENVKAAMVANYKNLTDTLSRNVGRAAQEAQNQFESVEDLSRWDEKVGKLYSIYGAANSNSLRFSSESRVTQIRQLEAMDEGYIRNLAREVMNEYFKVDIDRFYFSGKVNKLGSPSQLRNFLCDQAWRKFPEISANLIKTALDNVDKEKACFRVNRDSSRALDEALKESFVAILKVQANHADGLYYKLISQMTSEGEAAAKKLAKA